MNDEVSNEVVPQEGHELDRAGMASDDGVFDTSIPEVLKRTNDKEEVKQEAELAQD